jgi:RimJ/RimL family protein N-acetyltransferase
MLIRPTKDTDIEFFRKETSGDRLAEMTCRPIVGGRPVVRDPRREDWTFLLDDRPVGWISLFDYNSRNRSAEFGYGIVRPLRGKRIGRPMLVCAFDRFFTTTDLNKLYCQTASFNVASVRLLESLGLTRDGVLRAHHELDGELHDDYLYSLLKYEWPANRAASVRRASCALARAPRVIR